MNDNLSCLLRPVFDFKFAYITFNPIIYNTLYSNNRVMWLIISFILKWVWVYAFTCSTSGNLMIRVWERLTIYTTLLYISFFLINMYLPSNKNPIIIMALAEALTFILQLVVYKMLIQVRFKSKATEFYIIK